jgi:hypothetical protein
VRHPKKFNLVYEVTKEAYLRSCPKEWQRPYRLRRWRTLPKGEYGRLICHTRTIISILLEEWGNRL